MILVGGQPVASGNAQRDIESLLLKLLDHPALVASAQAMKETQVQLMKPPYPSGNEDFDLREIEDGPEMEMDRKYVYVFQKEFATVSPLFAELAGTDEITTCLGLVIRDPSSGLTSIGHFDSAECVLKGVSELVNSVMSIGSSTFQVHMVGAFDDSSDHLSGFREASRTVSPTRQPGWSWPLALKMMETLQTSAHFFDIETCCILKHNTSIGPNGHPCPSIRGFVVETSSGRFLPAYFEQESRGPDGTVRGVYTTTVSINENWVPTLISPYETLSDIFVIHPFKNSAALERDSNHLLTLADAAFLQAFSTSPFAEGPDFLPTSRRILQYVKDFPNVEQTFETGGPRIFTRTSSGGWVRMERSR